MTVSGDTPGSANAVMTVTVPPWHVTSEGNMTRRIPTVAQVFVLQDSQFLNKTQQHENKHLDQFIEGSGHIFGDLMLVDNFYAQFVNVSAPTLTQLINLIAQAGGNFGNQQGHTYSSRVCQAEQEAHNVSDPITPQYIYQWCGCDVQRQVTF